MKRKGFTLIELLAVIVILAIIALIATPLVLKYIEKSRQESKVDSAYSFVRNLETEIANYSIKNNGKKYNKTGLVEIGDFTDIDTTVKGDTPSNGKVCLSSLGQVDKAILQYDKYYVSYDVKKGSISDKDTYDNFKCENDNIIFDDDITFTYNEDLGLYVSNDCVDITKFKNKANYRITLDDNKTYDVISMFGKYYGEDMFALVEKYKFNYVQTENICWGGDDTEELSKEHHIKIEYINDEIYPHYLTIEPSELTVFSLELVAGDATVKIEDNNGNSSTFNVEVETDEMYSFIGITDYNTNYTASNILKPYYELVENGGTFTVTITQGENVYVLGGSEFTFEDDYYCDGELYYWGNHKLGYWFGC